MMASFSPQRLFGAGGRWSIPGCGSYGLNGEHQTQPFLIVLGAPLVPWDVEEVPRLSLGVGATLGPHNVVSCPTLSFLMVFLYSSVNSGQRQRRRCCRSTDQRQRQHSSRFGLVPSLEAHDYLGSSRSRTIPPGHPCPPRATQRYRKANRPSYCSHRTIRTLPWKACSFIFQCFRCIQITAYRWPLWLAPSPCHRPKRMCQR